MELSYDACGEGKLLNDLVTTPTQLAVASIGDSEWSYEFHENHGRNVQLEKKTVAKRVASYNQGTSLIEHSHSFVFTEIIGLRLK